MQCAAGGGGQGRGDRAAAALGARASAAFQALHRLQAGLLGRLPLAADAQLPEWRGRGREAALPPGHAAAPTHGL
jgi:hypothetical protein